MGGKEDCNIRYLDAQISEMWLSLMYATNGFITEVIYHTDCSIQTFVARLFISNKNLSTKDIQV